LPQAVHDCVPVPRIPKEYGRPLVVLPPPFRAASVMALDQQSVRRHDTVDPLHIHRRAAVFPASPADHSIDPPTAIIAAVQRPGEAAATPLLTTRPAAANTALRSPPSCNELAIRLSCEASPNTQGPGPRHRPRRMPGGSAIVVDELVDRAVGAAHDRRSPLRPRWLRLRARRAPKPDSRPLRSAIVTVEGSLPRRTRHGSGTGSAESASTRGRGGGPPPRKGLPSSSCTSCS